MIDRRGVMAGGVLAVAGAAFGAGADPFSLGVASGAPTSDGFVIWTRLAPQPLAPDGLGGMTGPAALAWEVAEDEAFRRIVRRGRLRTDPAWAHAAHVEVAGLRPGRPYWYRFTALGVRSPAGRARTAPARGAAVERIKLAVASCAHWEAGFFSAYRHMAAEDQDLTLFLGDYIYEYSFAASRADVVRRHDRAAECRTLADYRNRYALYKTDPDLQALHGAAPCLATWDDHEVQNEYGGDFSQIGTIPPEEFRARRLAAYRAFYEHMPLRRSVLAPAPEMRLYGRHDFGNLLRLTVLDGRQYRDVQPCPVGNSRRGHVAPLSCADLADPARSMLGQAQERWLYEGFRDRGPAWNLIAQDLLVAPLAQKDSAGRPGAFTDGWSGYAANRQRMLTALADSRLPNAVFLGGDMHAFLVTDLKADYARAGAPVIATEFVGAAISSNPAPDVLLDAMPANPHIKLFDNRRHGYMTAELTAGRMETRFRAITDRRDREAGVGDFRKWVVEGGRPGALPA